MGKLTIVSGPMFSGKTSHLINTYHKHNGDAIVVNYSDDNRYSETMLSTHDKLMIPCFKVRNLCELEKELSVILFKEKIKSIMIDEAQFYSDLVPMVLKFLELWNKDVYIYGLDSDFKRNPFVNLTELVPHADEFIKLKANCNKCGKIKGAQYSFRLTSETERVVIGNSNYIPLCRNCYIKSI